VHEGVAATHGDAQGFGLEQVADDSFGGQTFEVAQIAGGAHEEAKLRTLESQLPGNVRADKSCGSCKKDFHGCRA